MTETQPDASTITHVVVGLSLSLLHELDRLLPARSVLVVDEPETLEARNGRAKAKGYACVAEVAAAPTQDEPRAERLADAVPRPAGVIAVLPGLEYAVVGAAALAEAWGLPGAGVGAARLLRDKAELRAAADRHAIAQPQWREVNDPAGIDEFRARFDGRCVVKPANRQASVGVRLLHADSDTAQAWAHTRAADEPRMRARYALPPRHLVEQRLDGPEISVEALVRAGRAEFANITAKTVQHGDSPVELGHVVPAPLAAATAEAVLAATDGLLAATGFRDGIVHAEWILVDGTPHLIECAGRLPGDRIGHLIELAYDLDVTGAYLGIMQGAPAGTAGAASPAAGPVRAAAIRFLTCPPGTVTSVEGLDAARKLPGVTEAEVSAVPGATAGAVASSWDRPGHVVTTGADAAQAQERALDAAAAITISTEEPA